MDSINVIGSIDIPSGNVVEIHTKGFSLSNGSHFSALDNGELTVFVHDLSYNGGAIHEGVNLSNNSKFVGLLYSEKSVVLSNNATVEVMIEHEGSKETKSVQLLNVEGAWKLADMGLKLKNMVGFLKLFNNSSPRNSYSLLNNGKMVQLV